MIIDKFKYIHYKKAEVDGVRHYAVNKQKLPSVTTILDKTKPQEDKDALNNWRKRVGPAKAQEISTEAASRGTRMHKFLEEYIRDDILTESGTNPYSKQSHKMAQVIIDESLEQLDEAWGLEVPLFYDGLYAGTTDCVGVWNSKEAIIDFKQTNKPKKDEWIRDYKIQLCAYGEAHNKTHGTDIKRGVILMCSQDYQFQHWVIEGDDWNIHNALWWERVAQYYNVSI